MTVNALNQGFPMARTVLGGHASNTDLTHSLEYNDTTAEHLFLEVPLGARRRESEASPDRESAARVICPNCYHNQEKSERCVRCNRKLLGDWRADSRTLPMPDRVKSRPPRRRALPQPEVRRVVEPPAPCRRPLSLFASLYMILGILAGCLVSLSHALTFFVAESTILLPVNLPANVLSLIQLHTLMCVLILTRRGHK
ncbi:MAG: hypothetical protein QNK37_38685 [Acidobacteriota bacterium]|nr:hypothetical protein [Acidobacteriota bacterium]